ncbi:MAG TPA: alcohol dehydrogenase catalytic domain-containing protein, partial [Gaiellaceae bacterium]|nr:alcohol dehydrogenase catalytic domain-containing protein [Gaiellaceae bacterium]
MTGVPSQAAVCHAFGRPHALEQVLLREPREDEVLVRVEACAVCHSDVSAADGAWGGELPAVYG